MISIIIAGVGGQGAVLLSNILGLACARKGLEVKTGELHGLSQRSGSIITHLRIGEQVLSPLIPVGSADILASMELLEALRYIEFLKPGGVVVSSDRVMRAPSETIAVSRKETDYFQPEQAIAGIKQIASELVLFDGKTLAVEAGEARAENVVLLGALFGTGLLPLEEKDVIDALLATVPKKAADANLEAFRLGKEAKN
jgi:indolepyruvate ferredoxin oxidoreductase beta subunit